MHTTLKHKKRQANDNQAGEVAVKSNSNKRATLWWQLAWGSIILLGAALRLQRLSWQPLWWDEGYSVYFATEPLAAMLRLTALDIHPPFYYILLHTWLNLVGNSGPEVARLLSILIGVLALPTITWASLNLWPGHRNAALLATLLLAISPMHIYYSQEVRMYGLALLLTLLATVFMWRIQQGLVQNERPYVATASYVIIGSLALLTLYYTGLVLLTHQLAMLVLNRSRWRRQRWFLAAALLILLIQLPWWTYAFPKLFVYIADKVLADQDVALPIWEYLWRHWLAFTTGHLVGPRPWLEIGRQLAAVLIVPLLAICLIRKTWREPPLPYQLLLALLIIPTSIGFAVNLAYPFFPEGGERLLLQLLPYLLLLLSLVSIRLFAAHKYLAATAIIIPLIGAAMGNSIFFTTPRYAEHDYRPVIADVMQQSRADDTVLALFPWQVGYWRAYSPQTAEGAWLSPQPQPVDQTVLVWDDAIAASLDAALTRGTIWFPMPLSFGSTLPKEIEGYLANHARNLENHWYSPATRLTAWVKLEPPQTMQPLKLAYPDGLVLARADIAPSTATSANTPVAIDLCWQPPSARPDLRATLRLLDDSGYLWAKRDLTPLAAHAGFSGDDPCLESIAFNIPVGLHPATYQLAIGVGPVNSDTLFTPAAAQSSLISIGELAITPPTQSLAAQRLPIKYRLTSPAQDAGLLLHGYTGPGQQDELLAGDLVDLRVYLENTTSNPPAHELYVSILDDQGNGVAGWQEWPFPQYRPETWSNGALAQIPVQFYLPADLADGEYTLIAGFIDSQTGNKTTQSNLNRVSIVRRPTTNATPITDFEITPSPTFGTHATLIGHNVTQTATDLDLALAWEIEQSLLPPHHIFVHLFDASGQQIAQTDGEPHTSTNRAPTGSWLPGEYLITRHHLSVPPDASPPFTIRIGLYHPDTGARLPVTAAGATIGDSAEIALP